MLASPFNHFSTDSRLRLSGYVSRRGQWVLRETSAETAYGSAQIFRHREAAPLGLQQSGRARDTMSNSKILSSRCIAALSEFMWHA